MGWRWKKGDIRAMSREHMSTSWIELVTALAVMGVITFLWLI
jgi:hypothetical protein